MASLASSRDQREEAAAAAAPCFIDRSLYSLDPVKERLVDFDHTTAAATINNPMADNGELGHQDPISEPPIDEKMEQVGLLDPKSDPIDDDRGKKAEGDEAIAVSNAGVVKKEEDENGSSEEESEEEDSETSLSSESEHCYTSCGEEEESSSSSEEEEEEEEEGDEVEEGEINGDNMEEDTAFISDGEEETVKGPIKSKHEIEDLPPVPPVEVSLEPHHQTLPVGVVSSVLGNKVIVEGSEKHSPLNEGSILFITETRNPLGFIDEIFGPVKNPYYIVRHNSDKEIPPEINTGVAISFVAEFANHILNETSLYKKGYDASGADDEELSDALEFSDDEKEAEYKRSLRQKKRDTNNENQNSGFGKKNDNSKGAGFHKDKQSFPAAADSGSNPTGRASNPCTAGTAAPQTMAQAFPPQQQQFNPVPTQGGYFPHQQLQQLAAMQGGGLPMNWLPAQQQFGDQNPNPQQQNQFFNNFDIGIMPFQQQQLVPNLGNFPWFGGASNQSIAAAALVGLLGQVPPFGFGNVNQPQGLLAMSNEQVASAAVNPSMQQRFNNETRPPSMQQFQQGRSSSYSRGTRSYGRGGGRGRHSFGLGGGSQHNG